MQNPALFYVIIALGIIALGVGSYLLTAGHHLSAYGGIGAGIVLIIAGIAGAVVAKKPRA